jgi:hypothetical protein
VVNFFLEQFLGLADCRADVLGRHVILAAEVLESHTPGQAAQDPGDRDARAANHRFAVLNLRVNDYAIIRSLIHTPIHTAKQALAQACG